MSWLAESGAELQDAYEQAARAEYMQSDQGLAFDREMAANDHAHAQSAAIDWDAHRAAAARACASVPDPTAILDD